MSSNLELKILWKIVQNISNSWIYNNLNNLKNFFVHNISSESVKINVYIQKFLLIIKKYLLK